MQNIKKYFMTLALLLTAVTGAWAADTYTTVFELNGSTASVGKLTLGTSSVETGLVKIHDNTDEIAGIKITGTYNYEGGIYFTIAPETGSFKKGDKVSIAVCFNNSDNTKSVKAVIYADDHEKLLYTTADGINGRTTNNDPVVEEYVLPQDASVLYIGRKGNTATFVTTLKVERPASAEPTIDVKWDAATKSGTFVMPGSNVELQVEYFAESNLFLGKEALADKANISVLNGETAVAFDDDGKSTATVTEGNKVTAKFTGTKKILGMKVEVKKGPASKLASEVTPDDIFKVIASDGMIYDNIAAAESAGTTAQGLVVYVGSNTGNATYTHGMALALKDEANNTWSGAKDACNAKNTSTPIVGALWIQASKDQWNTMFNAVGGDCKLIGCFSSAGGTNLVKFGNYWSSSSYEDSGEQGDFYMFSDDDWPGDWGSTSVYYNDYYHVRACIVF